MLHSQVLVLVERRGVQVSKLVVVWTVQVPGAALVTVSSKPERERAPRNDGLAKSGWTATCPSVNQPGSLDGVFMIDDSEVNYVTLREQQEWELRQKGGGASLMSLSTPAPCDPCPTNSESGGAGYVGFGYSYVPTNLWLEIARVTNNLAFLVIDRKSTRLNSSHGGISRMPSSA